MARQRKLSPERKAFIRSLLDHYHPEDAQDVQEMLKDLLGDTLQGMPESEMDEKLGYSRTKRRTIVVMAMIISQLPVVYWYDLLKDHTYAEACLARLLADTYRLEMNGKDMRNLRPIDNV